MLCLEIGPLAETQNLLLQIDCLASEPQGTTLLPSLALGLQMHTAHLAFMCMLRIRTQALKLAQQPADLLSHLLCCGVLNENGPHRLIYLKA